MHRFRLARRALNDMTGLALETARFSRRPVAPPRPGKR
jgi:hypothetical protein